MDYAVWGLLETRLRDKSFRSVAALQNALKKVWAEVTVDELRKIVDNFPKRLRQCVVAEGGHFEA